MIPNRSHQTMAVPEETLGKPDPKAIEKDMAELLGISRTPAREDLLRLEQDGFLRNHVGRGFVVQPLDPKEPGEIYPIIIELECMALRLLPPLRPETIIRLRQLGQEIGAAETLPIRRLELDEIWHNMLVEHCNNSHLLRVLGRLKKLIQRYLHAYILASPNIRPSVDDHAQILDRLEAGDVDMAVRILTGHWQRSLDILNNMLGGMEK